MHNRSFRSESNLTVQSQLPVNLTLDPVDKLSVTVVMDNFTSTLMPTIGPAKRPSVKARTPARYLETKEARDGLRAEHGFSAWLTVEKKEVTGKVSSSILFDTGVSPTGVSENMRRLELNPKDAVALVMSHGHYDHTTGLDGVIEALGHSSPPIIIHPEFWNRRRILVPGRQPTLLPTVSRAALTESGFNVIEESRQPSFLLHKSLLVTGEVDRTVPYEKGLRGQEILVEKSWKPDPLTLDDQALIANVRGKGLVVITGCGHSGIINICKYARKLTGIKTIHAILGGFHLPDHRSFDSIIQNTISDLKEIAPDWIVPAHCTGFTASTKLAANLPGSFIQNSVGTRYEFTAKDYS